MDLSLILRTIQELSWVNDTCGTLQLKDMRFPVEDAEQKTRQRIVKEWNLVQDTNCLFHRCCLVRTRSSTEA